MATLLRVRSPKQWVVVAATSLCCCAIVLVPAAAEAQPAPPSEAAKGEAMRNYEAGSKAFADKRYKDAIDLFLEADEVVRNADLAFNTSLAYEAMGDVSSALRWAREYLRRAPSAEDRAALEKRIAGYEKKLQDKGVQQLTILSTPAGATVLIDGRPLGVTPWTGDLRPGSHAVVLTLAGHVEAKTVFELRPDRAGERALDLTPTPASTPGPVAPPVGPMRPETGSVDPVVKRGLLGGGIAALALGAAGVGAAVGLELLRAGAEEDALTTAVQVDSAALLDDMESYQRGARVAVGLGAGFMAVGAALIVTGAALRSTDDDGPAPLAFDLGCLPWHAGGTPDCALVVRGAF